MANFIGLVYGTLKEKGIDTSKLSTDEAVEKFKELQEKEGNTGSSLTEANEKQKEKDTVEAKENKTDNKIDYENVKYPAGTSKKYTMQVNEKYNKALPILKDAGIDINSFGGKESAEGGFEDNTEKIMNKYVFEPFNKKYPNGNEEKWQKEYKPLYDAIEAVADKNYNDFYIKKHQ